MPSEMILLRFCVYEYRQSRYANDPEYRARAAKNELLHMTLVEEAHNVLMKPHQTGCDQLDC